jgi:hypothetical protein
VVGLTVRIIDTSTGDHGQRQGRGHFVVERPAAAVVGRRRRPDWRFRDGLSDFRSTILGRPLKSREGRPQKLINAKSRLNS